MSIVKKWLLWSRKLYLLFPLKSLLFLQLILFIPFFFIMEELLRAKNVISFLVAAICIEIFYWFHIAESFLLCLSSSVVFEVERIEMKKKWKSRMGECHKNRNWTMLHLILSMRSHRIECMSFCLCICMLKNEHLSEMYCIDIV